MKWYKKAYFLRENAVCGAEIPAEYFQGFKAQASLSINARGPPQKKVQQSVVGPKNARSMIAYYFWELQVIVLY